MRVRMIWKFVLALILGLAPLSASADVLKLVIDGTIQPLSEERFDRAIQEAQRSHAEALLIELRTPGGLMSSMEDIIHKILSSQVPVIIYVTPSGSGAGHRYSESPGQWAHLRMASRSSLSANCDLACRLSIRRGSLH